MCVWCEDEMAIGGFLHIPPDMRCTAYSEGWVKNLYPDHTPCSSASHRVVHVAVYPLNIASQIFQVLLYDHVSVR